MKPNKGENAAGKKSKRTDSPTKGRSRNETSSLPPDISPDEVYRIAVLSLGIWPPSELREALKDAIPALFDGFDGHRLALFPGVQWDAEMWPVGTDEITSLLAQHEIAGLFEAFDGTTREPAYYAFEPGAGLLPVEVFQRFATSDQANADRRLVEDLVDDCAHGGERTITLDGVPVGLLVCGENNVLANRQEMENEPYIRHGLNKDLFGHVPIVFNGAHTPMGNWGKLDRRFRYLSEGRRWAFYATNQHRDDWGTSVLRAYFDGRLLADSGGVCDDGIVDVRVADPNNDYCLAIVLDIPGTMLAV